MINNIKDAKLGIVAVSRDCFPATLSEKRRKAVVNELNKINVPIIEIQTIIENEKDVLKALEEIKNADIEALVIYLGNFGPEGPETMLAQKFAKPVMFVAAAEETGNDLIDGRGDAYCGMLNASYNLNIRGLRAYIPEYPIGTAEEVAKMIEEYTDIARALVCLKKLKVFSFGPRPTDFVACNAPIKPLFDLGVEIMENSELDLYEAFNAHKDDSRIPQVKKEMEEELGEGNRYAGILDKLAQYEITLLDWAKENIGASEYFVFANKCWPAFQTQFGFVPCYVNSRLAAKGYPVSCETDIYGAVTEYIITAVSKKAATLLDINNSVPKDLYEENKEAFGEYTLKDSFMGFHCGNTSTCYLKNPEMKYQRIMKRSLEPNSEPDITRGTMEGTIKDGEITVFRLQSSADCKLKCYIANGDVINADPKSFGSIGIIAIKEMARFYRHILIEKNYPHHAGIAFKPCSKALFEVMKQLGIEDISYNQPKNILYKTENPFA